MNNAVKPRKQIKQTYDAGILRGGDVSTLPVGFPICSLDVRFKTNKKIQIDKTKNRISQLANGREAQRERQRQRPGGLAFQRGDLCVLGRRSECSLPWIQVLEREEGNLKKVHREKVGYGPLDHLPKGCKIQHVQCH